MTISLTGSIDKPCVLSSRFHDITICGFEKSKHLVTKAFSSDTLQSLKRRPKTLR